MRKLWRWATVGIGAIALAAGLAVTATQAGATAGPAIQITQSQHLAAASCTGNRHYLGGYVTFTACTGGISRFNCQVGDNGVIYGPLYAANGCSFQVYLWLTHTTSGNPALCVNPQSSTNVLKQYYEEFKVTSREGAC